MPVDAFGVIGTGALKLPARKRTVRINGAEVITTQELASSSDVRQHTFDKDAVLRANRRIDRKRREFAAFRVPLKQRGVIVAVLLAARGGAVFARARADDCYANSPPNPT